MRRIYIDANIYLRFYLLDQPLFQKILPAVSGIEKEIFVTKQIVDEVKRNKINAFLAHAGNFFAQIPKSPNLPSFDSVKDTQKAKDWRKKMSALKSDIENCSTEYKASIKAMAHSIANSSDPVSIQLEKIFRSAASPSETQLQRARLRKEVGNPPGKRSDPLGDQISWEQFLDQCKKDGSVWIITRDGDFFDVLIDELRLKPTLENDVRGKIGKGGTIYLFDDLVAGLESFKSNGGEKVKNLPTKEEIKEIYKEQVNNQRTGNNQIFVDPVTYTITSSPPEAAGTHITAISSPIPTATGILNSGLIDPSMIKAGILSGATNVTDTNKSSFFTITNSATSLAEAIVNRGLPTSITTTPSGGWTCQYCGSYNTLGGIIGSSICTHCYKSRW